MISEEYKKAYEKCLEDLKKDFEEHRKNNGFQGNGSNYNYLAKIGDFYFTHRDFAQALVSGEHDFYAFSRDVALKYIKRRKKERYEYYKYSKFLNFKRTQNEKI